MNQHMAQPVYADAVSLDHRKRFGQFFTPPNVAALMADWVITRPGLRVLDPALGTGVLATACIEKDPSTTIVAYEKDEVVLRFAPPSLLGSIQVSNGDFLASPSGQLFDAVIMNPPYIRHREIDQKEPFRSQISTLSDCFIPTSANLYIYFLLRCISMVVPTGRLSVLIPSEWMSANFSEHLKRYLIDKDLLRHIITFSHCSNVFDGALTTASVLMLEVNP